MIRVGSAALASFPHLSKAVTNPGHVLASRDITLLMKVHIVQAMVFPVVMYDVKVGPSGRLSTIEVMLSNCGVGGQQEKKGKKCSVLCDSEQSYPNSKSTLQNSSGVKC